MHFCGCSDELLTSGAICFFSLFLVAVLSQVNSDLPLLANIKVMGYSLRSWDYRYTLWLGFDPNTFKVGI